MKTFLRDARGASAVEFALLALPFLLLTLGTMEFARIMWSREVLKQVATAGARCMGIVQTECGPTARSTSMGQSFVVAEAGRRGFQLTTNDIVVNASTTCAGAADFSQVTITYTYRPIIPLLIPALGASLTLNASSCFPNLS